MRGVGVYVYTRTELDALHGEEELDGGEGDGESVEDRLARLEADAFSKCVRTNRVSVCLESTRPQDCIYH
jgi:hypothetical protein